MPKRTKTRLEEGETWETLVLPTKIAKLTTLASYSIILLENRCLSNQPRPTKRLLAKAPDDGPEVFEGEALLPEVQVLQPLKVGASWGTELFFDIEYSRLEVFSLQKIWQLTAVLMDVCFSKPLKNFSKTNCKFVNLNFFFWVCYHPKIFYPAFNLVFMGSSLCPPWEPPGLGLGWLTWIWPFDKSR